MSDSCWYSLYRFVRRQRMGRNKIKYQPDLLWRFRAWQVDVPQASNQQVRTNG